MVEQPEASTKFNSTIHTLIVVNENACHESLNAAMTDETCKEILDFVIYQDVLHQGQLGELAQFWMTYIDMV